MYVCMRMHVCMQFMLYPMCLQNISKTGRGTPTNDILVSLKVAEHGLAVCEYMSFANSWQEERLQLTS